MSIGVVVVAIIVLVGGLGLRGGGRRGERGRQVGSRGGGGGGFVVDVGVEVVGVDDGSGRVGVVVVVQGREGGGGHGKFAGGSHGGEPIRRTRKETRAIKSESPVDGATEYQGHTVFLYYYSCSCNLSRVCCVLFFLLLSRSNERGWIGDGGHGVRERQKRVCSPVKNGV